MYATLTELAQEISAPSEVSAATETADLTPAVSVRKSLGSNDHILSMIDGKPYRTVRRLAAIGAISAIAAVGSHVRMGAPASLTIVCEHDSDLGCRSDGGAFEVDAILNHSVMIPRRGAVVTASMRSITSCFAKMLRKGASP